MKIKNYNKDVKLIKKGDNVTLSIDSATYQLVLNATAIEVFDVLNKYEAVEELLDYMSSVYKKVDRRVLESDVMEVLRLFEIYGLIELESDQKESSKVDNICQYVLSGDINYNKVSQFIVKAIESENAVKFSQAEKEYYSPVVMRYRVMQNLEFGVFAEKNEQILGYISTSANPANYSKALVINDIVLDENLTQKEMIQHLSGMINRIFRLVAATRPISKIRLGTYGSKASKKIIEILEATGFEIECVLKDETTLGDMYFYSYYVK